MKQGWIWKSKEYGTWFISKEAVAEDWKRDYFEEYNEHGEPRELSDKEIETWHNEHITWVEVNLYGELLEGPDMNYWKEVFWQRMKTDYDRDFDAKEVQ